MKNKFLIVLFIIFSFIVLSGKAQAGSAALSWYPNIEPDLAGYRIYYGTAPRTGDCPPGGYSDKIDVGKTKTPENPFYTVENLEENKTYYFSLTSYNLSGDESCFSVEVSKFIPEEKISWYRNISRFFQGILSPLNSFFRKIL